MPNGFGSSRFGAAPYGNGLDTAPTLSGISPAYGPIAGGTFVTVTGTNFDNSTSFTVGGLSLTGIIVVSSTQATGYTQAHVGAIVDVVATNAAGSATLSASYNYVSPPQVISLSQVTGDAAGGYMVTITGSGFTPPDGDPLYFYFGGVAATSIVVSGPFSATCIVPAHAAGVVDVSATNLFGTGTLPSGFTYTNFAVITSIAPIDCFTIRVTFDAAVNSTSGVASNYTINNGITVVSAVQITDFTVEVKTSRQSVTSSYALSTTVIRR